MRNFRISLLCLLITSFVLSAQNQTAKWYFGNHAGLDFMTNPPTVLLNSAMNSWEGTVSESDPLGNLLFYSEGVTVWNKLHQVMANGTGLMGSLGSLQSALVIKAPGNSNLYYIFTVDDVGGVDVLRYSVIDISLASGNGSVTVKNVLLHTPSTEQLTGIRHCNGTDFWVVAHDFHSNIFRSILVSSAGVSSVAVLSPIGPTITGSGGYAIGSMKISPEGKKLAATNSMSIGIDLYDFDSATGIVSNSLSLGSFVNGYSSIEFSPDGSKLYGGAGVSLSQWDLCAGSNSAIVASHYLAVPQYTLIQGMQLAKNHKIYIGNQNQTTLASINQPNLAGAACDYSTPAQSIAPNKVVVSLPNFIGSFFREKPSSFSYSIACQKVEFKGISCSAFAKNLISTVWNFGDSNSGNQNTSNLLDPAHYYSYPGVYPVQLILNYPCYSDTISQFITVSTASPTFVINGPKSVCKNEMHTLSVSNPTYNYNWAPIASTATSVNSPSINTVFTVTSTDPITGCSFSITQSFVINNCLSLSDKKSSEPSIRVFPNPTNGIFQIESDKTFSFEIKDLLGRIVLKDKMDSDRKEIDLSEHPNGMYRFRYYYDGRFHEVKLVKGD